MSEADSMLTPDRRYLVVRGRLWRASNPNLGAEERAHLVVALMDARRAVRAATKAGDAIALRTARNAVDAAKHGLGERGPVWWTDGSRDYNRHMVENTPYAAWFDTTMLRLHEDSTSVHAPSAEDTHRTGADAVTFTYNRGAKVGRS